jgi:hypothetical protein
MAKSWAILDGLDDVLIKPFMPDGAIVALDIGILLGLSRLERLTSGAAVGDHGRDGGPLGIGQVGGVGAARRQGVGPGLLAVDV